MSSDNSEFIFRAKTKEAFVIKILGELLYNSIRFAPFHINEKGIFLLQTDGKSEPEQMIDICLFKENFSIYKCAKPFTFSVNSTHFYKMLKHIKKKDGITLFISEADELTLGITVEQSDENDKVTTYIRITPARPDDIDRPDGYDNPIIMTSKEFQKMKNLQNISSTITVTSKLDYIKFFVDGGTLFSRELVIGNENNEENKHISKMFKQTFNTSHISSLTKCAGQSGNVQIFVHEDLGMKIKMKAGNLGEITVYIKSMEIINDEIDEAEQKNEQKDDDGLDDDISRWEQDEEDSPMSIQQLTLEDARIIGSPNKTTRKSPKSKVEPEDNELLDLEDELSEDEEMKSKKTKPRRKTKATKN